MVLPGDLVTLKVQEHNIDKVIRVISVDRRIKTGELTCVVSNYLDEKWEKKIEGPNQFHANDREWWRKLFRWWIFFRWLY